MATVLVIGATGRQGGAVVSRLLAREHTVLALVRSVDAPAASKLRSEGVTLVQGDLSDHDSILSSARRADAIFGLSVPFGPGGKQEEVTQGETIIEAAAATGAHLVYSSVRGGDQLSEMTVEHAGSKQIIEAKLRPILPNATVLGPVFFMENALNFGFTQLDKGRLAMPLSPAARLDQVTVLDIAAVAVEAIENPDEFAGKRIDLASDSVTGEEAAAILSSVTGLVIPYVQLPIADIRMWAGDEIASMYESFETNTDFVDIPALRNSMPELGWHRFEDWARTVDWSSVFSAANSARKVGADE